jgi:hypothetical protein
MRGAIIAGIVATLISATSATAAFVVTSRNIKNGTIQTVDISAKAKAALRGNRGPRGLRGLSGPVGPAGPAGSTGAQGTTGRQGPPGIAKAYMIDEGFGQVISVPDVLGPIARINLPLGWFVVFASASFSNPGAAEALIECHLAGAGGRGSGPDFGRRYATVGGTGSGGPADNATIALQATVFADAASTYDFECSDNGGQATVSSLPSPNLTAVQVDAVFGIQS